MNTIQEIEKRVESALEWSIETFGNEENDISIRKISHMEEEVGELKEALIKYKNDPSLLMNLKFEYVDNLILLLTSAKQEGIDLSELMTFWDAKMITNRNRKWGARNEKGYNKHIKIE